MSVPRMFRVALTGFVVLLATAPVSGCGGQHSANPAASGRELPDQEVSDFVLTETDQGVPCWTLFARYSATYNARNLIIARGVRVDFFSRDGKGTSTLTAREGEIHQVSRDMTARGDVVITSAEGVRMSTEEMRFVNREQRIVVPDDRLVRVEREQDVLTGYGFESDPDLRHYEVKRNVSAQVRPRAGGTLPPAGGRR
jgi:LPS export ABC transporter protein LptC